MLGKKGVSHIDWAFSIGIFLLYVLFLFLFLKPGVKEIYEETNLLEIVEAQFDKATMAKIDRTPLFLSNVPAGTNDLELAFSLSENPENSKWAVVYANYTFLKSEFSPIALRIADIYVAPGQSTLVLWILNASDFDYSPYASDVTCDLTNICLLDGTDFTSSFGLPEPFEGASSQKIAALLLQNPDQLKEEWDFPSNAGFNVSVILSSQSNYTIENVLSQFGESPAAGIGKIAVREWKIFFIEGSSLMKSAIVNVRVWKK